MSWRKTKTVMKQGIDKKSEWFFKQILHSILGVCVGFIIGYLLLGTIIHEFLHSIPFVFLGIPYIISAESLTSFPFVDYVFGISDLIVIMPYLVTVLIGVGFIIVGFGKKHFFMLSIGVFLILFGIFLWWYSGWHEYMGMLWGVEKWFV